MAGNVSFWELWATSLFFMNEITLVNNTQLGKRKGSCVIDDQTLSNWLWKLVMHSIITMSCHKKTTKTKEEIRHTWCNCWHVALSQACGVSNLALPSGKFVHHKKCKIWRVLSIGNHELSCYAKAIKASWPRILQNPPFPPCPHPLFCLRCWGFCSGAGQCTGYAKGTSNCNSKR